MVAGYRCGTNRRRADVRGSTTLNGIDFLEVDPGEATLRVHFLNGLPGTPDPVPPAAAALDASNLAIDGGVRLTGIVVTAVAAAAEVLTVTVSRPGWTPGGPMGDYSTYTLRVRSSSTDDRPPDGFDPQLSSVDFSFKAGCETDFDCETDEPCPPEIFPEPDIDYLAKDYASFRGLMLDRMAATMPAWTERHAADVEIALVELLAYVGDHLSYYQDAVATEAYLETALKRTSIRRHARLLDYRMHDGCNARAWVCFAVDPGGDGTVLEPGTRILSAGAPGSPVVLDPTAFENAIALDAPAVFETMTEVTLRSAHNEIHFHQWDEEDCCLPAGCTSATLVAAPGVSLTAGDVLAIEEVLGPETGAPADADPTHRWVVRLTATEPGVDHVTTTQVVDVSWSPDDALPFPVCISKRPADGTDPIENVSVARGNVALADHGRTVAGGTTPDPSVDPSPAQVPDAGPYRPVLPMAPLAFVAPPWPADRPATPAAPGMVQGASLATQTDPADALPAVTSLVSTESGGLSWTPRADLLGSDRFAADFVVETDSEGAAHLRFGDGELGLAPESGSTFTARYRIGGGRAGNVGGGALGRVAPAQGLVATLAGNHVRLWNPLPATGGVDPEPVEHVKLVAPFAFRRQERAVTEADYADVTGRMAGVQQAAATVRWTGSWYTAFVTVDRTAAAAAAEAEDAFEADARTWLDLFRMAGTDVEVDGPVPMPIDLALQVCVATGHFAADVEEALRGALGSRPLPGGTKGFFHPDNFTFGQPVFLSQVYRSALAVPGVSSVNATRFQRWGARAVRELEDGVIVPGRLEIARLDDDPNFPENGRLELDMTGGA